MTLLAIACALLFGALIVAYRQIDVNREAIARLHAQADLHARCITALAVEMQKVQRELIRRRTDWQKAELQ